ncbi:hypothetical protein [Hyalangium versicolor]|uniref:hypothetical protein n=1 Tax=Hyalangium versicolor TaxID=2861190 RepID=UPI001CCF2538|nr:hypothetical protein [Hyalangium versicolor]
MKRVPLTSQQLLRSLILWPTMVLALTVSACGTETKPIEGITPAPVQEQPTEDDVPCTLTEDSPPPTLSISDSGIDIFLECNAAWKAPDATAKDACGQPLEMHVYNSGDDDGDGIAGCIDPDDFGPGPSTSINGLYYVQYLAWDEFFHVSSVILSVYVENCPE